jgi:hypothetical protein
MHSHGLCGVFYTARNPKLSAGAKRIVGGSMTATAATDAFGAPVNDFIEQAHASMMRNMALDPRAV